MFDAFKAKLEEIWHKVDGEARAELETAVHDLEAEAAKLQPLLGQFKADIEAAVTAVEPEVRAAVIALAEKLLQDAGQLLGNAPAKPEPPAAA